MYLDGPFTSQALAHTVSISPKRGALIGPVLPVSAASIVGIVASTRER